MGCHPGGILLTPCPPGLLWDDEFKICRMESSTCNRRDVIIPEHADGQAEEAKKTDAKPEALQTFQDVSESNQSPDTLSLIRNTDDCVLNSCDGKEVGRYAFCKSCRLYVYCNPKGRLVMQGCPPGLKWDDAHKRCKIVSSTCGLSWPHDSSEEDTAESTEDPAESTEDPAESAEDPVESVESAEDPVESAESAESAEDPAESAESVESAEDPVESAESVESAEDPAESAEDPAESAEENLESAESKEVESNELYMDRPKIQDFIEALREKARKS